MSQLEHLNLQAADAGRVTKILLVEDDRISAAAFISILADRNVDVHLESDGQAALEHLAGLPYYDIVVLDRNLPGLDGLSLLKTIKARQALKHIPVIMQTSQGDDVSLREGIAAGAFHYLVKPLAPELVLAVFDSVMELANTMRQYQLALQQQPVWFAQVQELCVRFQTLEDARALAQVLANFCPDPEKAFLGLWELMVNAVEHGNLGIDYDEKSALISQGKLDDAIAQRLLDPVLGKRWASARFTRAPGQITVLVQDEGQGFDWEPFMDVDPARAYQPNGRGIAMARLMSFDQIEFKGNGNTVLAVMTTPD